MKIKLGTLEFEAVPFAPQYPPRNTLGFPERFRSYFENSDYVLLMKGRRDVYAYDCKTKTENRHGMDLQNRITIETDLFAFYPKKRKLDDRRRPLVNAPKKARKFANAAAKAAGFANTAGLNTALQAVFGSFQVVVPIAKCKASFHPKTSFGIAAKITYQHYVLNVPGKQLQGYLFVSFPIAVEFEAHFRGRCAKPKKGVPSPPLFNEMPRPLLPDNLASLGITQDAFQRHRKDVEAHIEWLRKMEQKERDKPLTKGLTEKKAKREEEFRDYMAEIYGDGAKRRAAELEEYDKALREKKAELAGG
ncbi:MAG: hypothetical protein ACI86S_002444 [Paracoccaceae bacterium]|jgi:hypothetical protein